MVEIWQGEKEINHYWDTKLNDSNGKTFNHDDMHKVVDDIVCINDVRSGFSLEENRSYELNGVDGPIKIEPGVQMEGIGVSYNLDIGHHDANDIPVLTDHWYLVGGLYRRSRYGQTGVLYRCEVTNDVAIGAPIRKFVSPLIKRHLDDSAARSWVTYVWDAFSRTPKSVTQE